MFTDAIDTSTYQGNYNPNDTGKQIFIIRSSYGVGYTDAQFHNLRRKLREQGKAFGTYHYAYPQYNTPEREAQWYLDVVGQMEAGEVLVLDHEENWAGFEDWKNWAAIFLEYIKNKTGIKPLLYINKSREAQGNWKRVIDGDFGLWLALWDGNKEIPATQWSVVAMKQYSATGRVNGIAGDVDLDVFYGDVATFKRYGYQPPAPKPDEITFEIYRNTEHIDSIRDFNAAKKKYSEMKLAEADVKTLVKFNITKNVREQLETYTEPVIPKPVTIYGVDLSGTEGVEYEFDTESDALNAFEIQKQEMDIFETIDLLKITRETGKETIIEKLQTFTKPEPVKPSLWNDLLNLIKAILELIRQFRS
jgi:GH25 family lysozyme M1 (1,4-beta-N-acetylmuramidase)